MLRREFLKRIPLGLAALSAPMASACSKPQPQSQRPGVLFISIDDLNDWVGALGGHPQAQTPNIDALAARGVLFSNAHCDAPGCFASRVATLTGLRPSTSGVYNRFSHPLRATLPEVVTLPQSFMRAGYRVVGTGKVFHEPDPASWHDYYPSKRQTIPSEYSPPRRLNAAVLPRPDTPNSLLPDATELRKHLDWGSLDVPRSELSDPQAVAWATQQLARSDEGPLFLACGLYRPHVPWYVPKEFFDLYPLEDLQRPLRLNDDLADVPEIASPPNTWQRIVDHGQERPAMRAYLAAVSFADSLVGELLAGLDASGRADDTIIVLWSDNGMHLGEKSHIFKSRLWEESTRIPLVIVAPGVTSPGGVCERPVNLTDLYPTLTELCAVPAPEPLDGSSLVPLLRRPSAPWGRPAIITNGPGNIAIRTQRWRYIRYRDGSEELYDHDADPHEWTNLAAEPTYRPVIADLARWLPG